MLTKFLERGQSAMVHSSSFTCSFSVVSMYPRLVVIFVDDLEPGKGAGAHPTEPIEWVLWDRMSRFGSM